MLKLYNTLTKNKDEFKPLVKGKVGMYSCGPTVYDFAHIGNFRAYIAVDLLKRYLKFKGFNVKHVMNLTDVDDKTIKGSQKQGLSLREYTEIYSKAFFEDLKSLNIDPADVFPKATNNINEMVDIIKKLLDKGVAYRTEDGSIYFDISKFEEYGQLSKIDLSGRKAGARVSSDEYEKDDAHDFALWKSYTEEDGDVYWETEIGKGRPGWHIECSAMSTKYLGQPFDIHGGGVDLIFPHHENEIAQSKAATGKDMAKYWFHNEHLLVDNKKMSKSLGNFFTLRDLLNKGYKPMAIRYLLLSVNYRQKLNFTQESVKSAENSVDRLNEFIGRLKKIRKEISNDEVKNLIENAKSNFEKEMDDDLNISNALAVVFDFVKIINTMIMEEKIGKQDANNILDFMKQLDSVLGVMNFESESIPEEVQVLISKREDARKAKDWELSDKLRDEIKEKGFIVKDTKDGSILNKI